MTNVEIWATPRGPQLLFLHPQLQQDTLPPPPSLGGFPHLSKPEAKPQRRRYTLLRIRRGGMPMSSGFSFESLLRPSGAVQQ